MPGVEGICVVSAVLPQRFRRRPGRRQLIGSAAVLLAATSGAVFVILTTRTRPRTYRLNSGSGYQNIQPGVKYVGDLGCIRCHGDLVASFRRTPMGSSLGTIATENAVGGLAAADQPHFEAQGLAYSVENRGGRFFHAESRKDTSGADIARLEAEVQYALGAGRQAFAFLIERDGFLFESPITWYARERKWDLSPGYERKNDHFDRPILEDCLFCHTNRVERASSALNRYRAPIFHGYGIGCEWCHGPGELHVRGTQIVDGRDLTIVNPATLQSSLGDAICEQRHLIGRRINRPQLRSDDFRAGLPFFQFWSAFVHSEESGGDRFASQAEQMHDSRCFRDSNGNLRCISCHHPHVMPAAGERVAYLRDRCLECHTDRGCSLPAKVRIERQGADDCTGCHMPQSHSSNNVHVATTDHRISRHADETPRLAATADSKARRAPRLVNFHRRLMSDQERSASQRDLGITLCREGRTGAVERAAAPRGGPGGSAARPACLGRQGRSTRAFGPARRRPGGLSKGPCSRAASRNRAGWRSQPGVARGTLSRRCLALAASNRHQPMALRLPRGACACAAQASRLERRGLILQGSSSPQPVICGCEEMADALLSASGKHRGRTKRASNRPGL